jgi:hypothetical protein
MASSASIDIKADRVALVRRVALVHQVRRLADEIDSLHFLLDHAGALVEIRRYSQVHSEQIPDLDLLQTAKALRSYAGTLSVIASTAPKSKPASDSQPASPRP